MTARLLAEAVRLRQALWTALAELERRCACGRPRTWSRHGAILVGSPNLWCDVCWGEYAKTLKCHPSRVADRDDYQLEAAEIVRAALEAPEAAGGGEDCPRGARGS